MNKSIYLDIDMDYFVEPILKESVDNIRLYADYEGTIRSAAPMADKLKAKGIAWGKSQISCFTNHKTSYTHWWIRKKQDHILIHIDAHSDLYRNSGQDLRKLHNGDIGCYNYIWYGIRDGYIGEVFWVIPEGLTDLLDTEQAENIVNKALILEKSVDQEGLHINMQCILATGEAVVIPLHICTLDQLPNFAGNCEKVTIATSPEFIPAAADELIYELLDCMGAPAEMAHNIYRQHKDMLNKTDEEIAAAWKKLKK